MIVSPGVPGFARGHLDSVVQCLGCDAGMYQNEYSQASCVACGTGRFSNTTTNTGCDPCQAGFFADVAASERCQMGGLDQRDA